MKYDPANPKWPSRDRFVLSNGHACALQYVFTARPCLVHAANLSHQPD